MIFFHFQTIILISLGTLLVTFLTIWFREAVNYYLARKSMPDEDFWHFLQSRTFYLSLLDVLILGVGAFIIVGYMIGASARRLVGG